MSNIELSLVQAVKNLTNEDDGGSYQNIYLDRPNQYFDMKTFSPCFFFVIVAFSFKVILTSFIHQF